MGLIVLILLSALIGWIVSTKVFSDLNQTPLTYIIIGIVGSILASMLVNFFGYSRSLSVNLYSLIATVSGAIILIFVVRIIIHNK